MLQAPTCTSQIALPFPLLGNAGSLAQGVDSLEKAVGCKYVAAEAVKALNNIFQVRGQMSKAKLLNRFSEILCTEALCVVRVRRQHAQHTEPGLPIQTLEDSDGQS